MDVNHILHKLATSQQSVEWAILALDARQTEDEKEGEQTVHLNARGWNRVDAWYGGGLANFIKKSETNGYPKGSRLTREQVKKARPMLVKYAGQLLRIIAEKAQRKPAIGHSAVIVPVEQWHPTFAQEPF